MAAREVVVRMKKNVSSKCPAVTSVLTVPLSSPPLKPPEESGPPSPQVATAAQGCLTMTLGTRPWTHTWHIQPHPLHSRSPSPHHSATRPAHTCGWWVRSSASLQDTPKETSWQLWAQCWRLRPGQPDAGVGGPLGPTVSSPVQKQVQGKLKSPGILEAPRRQPNPAQHTGAHTHPDLASWSQRTWTSLPLNPRVLICKTEVAPEKTP